MDGDAGYPSLYARHHPVHLKHAPKAIGEQEWLTSLIPLGSRRSANWGAFLRPEVMFEMEMKSLLQLRPSQMKEITRTMIERPDNTPEQRACYEDMLRDIGVYEMNQSALQRANSDTAKWGYMPEFTGYFSKSHANLTPRQIEAEYTSLFDRNREAKWWDKALRFRVGIASSRIVENCWVAQLVQS